MMLMQMKNTERVSLTLQRATFLGSANVRPTPQMKDKKNMVLLHASGAVPTNPKPKPTSPTTVACSCDIRPYLTLMKWSISEAINPSKTSNNSASKNAELHNSNIWLKKILAGRLFTVARMHTQHDKQARWSHKSRFGLSPEVPGIKNPIGP